MKSKAFSLKGGSNAYRALMWAALRGQVDGLVGWPASDDEVKIKLQWLWLVSNKATELLKTRRPFLMLGTRPRTALQRSPQQVSFEEEVGVPLSEITVGAQKDTYYVLTNMLLQGSGQPLARMVWKRSVSMLWYGQAQCTGTLWRRSSNGRRRLEPWK